MRKKYTDLQFSLSMSRDMLPLECFVCGNDFFIQKKEIQWAESRGGHKRETCSVKCMLQYNIKLRGDSHPVAVPCKNCNLIFKKQVCNIKKTKNNFCSKSCAAKYNNTHKTKGTRRSKLEVYLEQQFTLLYPNLEIHFNRKDAINSELDIYFPSLKLAIELNGIFHYEPIYGLETLSKIKNNDNRKFQACLEQDIELCIIDTSSQRYFKEKTSKKYLDIIVNLLVAKGVYSKDRVEVS